MSKKIEVPVLVRAQRKVDAVTLEQLFSTKPRTNNGPTTKAALYDAEPCLRDMVFDYYCGQFQDTDKASAATKAYLDALAEKFMEK